MMRVARMRPRLSMRFPARVGWEALSVNESPTNGMHQSLFVGVSEYAIGPVASNCLFFEGLQLQTGSD